MNEIKLIYQCKKNNQLAQAELYQKYKNQLYVLCLKYCKNRADAEDVLQDSFISIFTHIDTYKLSGSFEGWMKRITINKAIDKYHKTKDLHLPIIDNRTENITIESELLQDYSLDVLLQFIQELPDKYRLVFNLYQLDGYSHKEIADLLNIAVGTSKSNLYRAKKILKKKLLESNISQQYG